MLFDLLNPLIHYWINAPIAIAWAMAAVANIAIYLIGALGVSRISQWLIRTGTARSYDANAVGSQQYQREIRRSLLTCLLLACTSLFTRELYGGVWPESLTQWFFQVLLFVVYYEVYSYGIHRLFHTRLFRKAHGVHHRSVITTPFSAYSVHPIEALSIGLSAPLFMLVVDFSLGPAFILHEFGMLFTVGIHANIELTHWGKPLNRWTRHHQLHHALGNRNFGFTSLILDRVFGTAGPATDPDLKPTN